MIDHSRRRTLKTLTMSVGTLAAGTLGAAVSSVIEPGPTSGVTVADGQIQVATRVSSLNNDLEIVLTNTSARDVAITEISPAKTIVPRGQFDFSALVENGPLRLDAGASVSVPLQHQAVSIVANISPSVPSLREKLGRSMKIITGGNKFAKVTVLRSVTVA